jgi:isochorismate hydrolase
MSRRLITGAQRGSALRHSWLGPYPGPEVGSSPSSARRRFQVPAVISRTCRHAIRSAGRLLSLIPMGVFSAISARVAANHVQVRDQDIVVRKTRFGAFATTDPHAGLHAHGIDTLILAGVSTSGVVLSTVRHATDEDYRLYLLADATADTDPEVHRVLIDKVFPHQTDIITTGDLPTLSGESLKL